MSESLDAWMRRSGAVTIEGWRWIPFVGGSLDGEWAQFPATVTTRGARYVQDATTGESWTSDGEAFRLDE